MLCLTSRDKERKQQQAIQRLSVGFIWFLWGGFILFDSPLQFRFLRFLLIPWVWVRVGRFPLPSHPHILSQFGTPNAKPPPRPQRRVVRGAARRRRPCFPFAVFPNRQVQVLSLASLCGTLTNCPTPVPTPRQATPVQADAVHWGVGRRCTQRHTVHSWPIILTRPSSRYTYNSLR